MAPVVGWIISHKLRLHTARGCVQQALRTRTVQELHMMAARLGVEQELSGAPVAMDMHHGCSLPACLPSRCIVRTRAVISHGVSQLRQERVKGPAS